jgi:hypothetical protein
MKRVTILGTILIMLAVLVAPAMAKSPFNNGDKGKPGNGNPPVVVQGDKNKVSEQDQERQQTQDRNGNGENHGNGNHGVNHGNSVNAPMRNPFYLQGQITGINRTAMTITVRLFHGNARVKQFLGDELTLLVTGTTQFYKINQMDENGGETGESTAPSTGTAIGENGEEGPNRVAITFDQLAINDMVAIHGKLVGTVYTATLVTVYVRAPEGEPVGSQG